MDRDGHARGRLAVAQQLHGRARSADQAVVLQELGIDARAGRDAGQLAEIHDLGLDAAYAVQTPDDNRRLYARWASTYETDFVAANAAASAAPSWKLPWIESLKTLPAAT